MDQPLREVTLDETESRLLHEMLLRILQEQTQKQLEALRTSRYADVEPQTRTIAAAGRMLGVTGRATTFQATQEDIAVLSKAVVHGLGAILRLKTKGNLESVLEKGEDPQEVHKRLHETARRLIELHVRLDTRT